MTRRPRTLLTWLRHEARAIDRWCGKAIAIVYIVGIPFVSSHPTVRGH